jgi:hypothetical protein
MAKRFFQKDNLAPIEQRHFFKKTVLLRQSKGVFSKRRSCSDSAKVFFQKDSPAPTEQSGFSKKTVLLR